MADKVVDKVGDKNVYVLIWISVDLDMCYMRLMRLIINQIGLIGS